MLELAKEFIPCVDEVWRLQNRQDPDCRHFQRYMEEGHMRGVPNTKQGIYAATPSGMFLASTNTLDGAQMADMLRRALDRWKSISKKDRLLAEDPAQSRIERTESRCPKDGLVLKVHSRDLERDDLPNDWTAVAWNLDFAWFRRDEMRSLLPKELTQGAKVDWPEALVKRLARFHFLDNVRGQTDAYEEGNIVEAGLTTSVVKVARGVVSLRFAGATRASTTGRWPDTPDPNTRGLGTKILGTAAYDPSKEKFTAFELVAAGTRWGMTRFNFRENDRKPGPIGFVLTLAGDKPQDRAAPAFFGQYHW